MSKRCKACRVEKDEMEFNKQGRQLDGLHPYCRACQSAKAKALYAKNPSLRRSIVEAKARNVAVNRALHADYLTKHPCVDCGEDDPMVLDFDHVRGVKLMPISEMISSNYSWKAIRQEITKCAVRCANCHRRKTGKDQRWFKGLAKADRPQLQGRPRSAPASEIWRALAGTRAAVRALKKDE